MFNVRTWEGIYE